MNYYNEFDPAAAAWLRELINAGMIPDGDVDERSIEDVRPSDLRGYTQCHFFAGIGGWPLALALAGWPTDRPVWTGSCPCQPFSTAGAGAGFADERHLWPAFFHLIAQCQPPAVFGEQVASAAVGPWLDLVHADLEALDYAFGSVAFPAAGVGTPHIRDRTYWVAYAANKRYAQRNDSARFEAGRGGSRSAPVRRGNSERLADADNRGEFALLRSGEIGTNEDLRRGSHVRPDGYLAGRDEGRCVIAGPEEPARPGPVNGHWRSADWLGCRDGKWRPVEPGTFPLAHGLPAGVGRLRGYGNAIVPQAAAEFILACS